MKIVITGAGGGHFYPLLAVVERIYKEAFIQKIIQPEIYFISDQEYDEKALFELQVKFVKVPAGKLRVYPSLATITDLFKTLYGMFYAIFVLYKIYPDVIFSKGGYASFPTLFAARILSIPVIVHESDTVPGRTTKWAGKFATRVAISYPEAASFYPKEKIALTGQPVREALMPPENYERIYGEKDRPVLLVIGGSQGSQAINDALLKMLPELLNTYDIVHQAGSAKLNDVRVFTDSILREHPYKDRYYVEGFIDVALFYPKVDLAITRAGSMIFELALWQLPMIIIPIPESISRDQRSNAYAAASLGVATVIEESNLSSGVLLNEIKKILDDKSNYKRMSSSCKTYDLSRNAASTIAKEIVRIGLSHYN
ncbi:MAG: UDP-N-acetylglucosamine--N-acetylmuramyl-(pentapeptide) pyrophosphoryl-undecaprenol N-acetylglucosamine transferase [Candidatus Nomurabacteria bacterium]|nr:UDP-N-acetylglucosamine--N-acetylmuramyl-(pentapeptide) pyrophosphoryl-undecaprenol N-acetylglucosamine transferase [Candidatus Nomurabacteria bacterium]